MNAAIALLETAASAGVEVCFANPGTTEMALVDALDRVDGMRAVLCLFEGVCTGAADGYGRMTGRPALSLLHLGPGFANGIANLHNARRARTPLVNLIGDQASWHLAHDAPLTSDIVSLASPVSGWLRTSASAKDLPGDTAAAIAAASGPPGRVATLILPADFQAGEADGPCPVAPRPARATVDPARVEETARRLREAGPASRRASLLLGGAALSERGLRAAGRVAAATGARLLAETFASRWERGGDLPAPDRLPYLPEQATALIADDCVLVLAGARSPVSFFGYPGLPSLIAPSLARLELASGEEDAAGALEALADALDAPAWRPAGSPARAEAVRTRGPLDPFSIGALLADRLPEGAIVVDEAATSGLGFYTCSASGPRHSLLALTGGAIGQGLPCATGAALACPDRPVIAFQADGSALYTIQALWTQARESLDVVTLLCSNRAYRILQMELGRAGVTDPGPKARSLTSLADPELDFVSLARGFGVEARRVDSCEALAAALDTALAARGPQLIELAL